MNTFSFENIHPMDNAYYLQFVTRSKFIKDNSKATYIANLKRISAAVCEAPLHNILYQPDIYAPVLHDKVKSLDSIKALITSLLVVMRSSDIKFLYPHVYNGWYKAFKGVKQKLIKRFLDQKPTEKHVASFVPWETIIEARDKLTSGSKEHLLLSITTMIPPRRQMDWFKVRVYTGTADKPVHDHNLIHIGHQRPFISLVDYKTAKFYKRWWKDIPDTLLDVLQHSLRLQPRQWLFLMRDKTPYKDEKAFARWTNGVFKRILDNKHASMNTLRHSYADYVRRTQQHLSLNDKSKIARDMGHNLFMSEGYAHRMDDFDKQHLQKAAVKVPRNNSMRM